MAHPDHESRQDCDSSFSEEEEEGSCYSTVFYSTTAGGSYDEFRFELEDIKVCGGIEKEVEEKCDTIMDCRICHMGLDESPGVAIELGCSCKDDLAVAHKDCADQWFTIKGNKTCEICNSVARNVTVQNELQPETGQQQQEEGIEIAISIPSSTAAAAAVSASDRRSCWQGHRFLNFLLGCMVFALVVSWLFHFNVSA